VSSCLPQRASSGRVARRSLVHLAEEVQVVSEQRRDETACSGGTFVGGFSSSLQDEFRQPLCLEPVLERIPVLRVDDKEDGCFAAGRLKVQDAHVQFATDAVRVERVRRSAMFFGDEDGEFTVVRRLVNTLAVLLLTAPQRPGHLRPSDSTWHATAGGVRQRDTLQLHLIQDGVGVV